VLRNDEGKRAIWLEHLLWCLPVLAWLTFICHMPLWIYVLTMVVPGNGILLIRSFAEHRARPGVLERTAIVEGSWLLGPLFLFNNLHAMHHEEPAMPWYEYNARYRLIRPRLVAENAGLVYSTYFDVARRFLFARTMCCATRRAGCRAPLRPAARSRRPSPPGPRPVAARTAQRLPP